MTLIVSDASPLNLLIKLGLAEILARLFSQVTIPTEVANELRHPKAPEVVQLFIKSPPPWLLVRSPQNPISIPNLDPGECAAISLAIEMQATLMIDEREGRSAALSRGLQIIGAIGVLERAANEGYITDLASVYKQIGAMRFHVAQNVLDDSLSRHLAHKRKND